MTDTVIERHRWESLGRILFALCVVVSALSAARSAPGEASPEPAEFGLEELAQELRVVCPCAGPRTGGSWRSHGAYVSCVMRAARRLAREHGLPRREVAPVARERAAADCGRTGDGQANVHLCFGASFAIDCETISTAHVDDCSECAAALEGRLVTCARRVDALGGEQITCGAKPAGGGGRGRVVERRTGLDCATCEAKLGTEIPDGLSCLAAECPGL